MKTLETAKILGLVTVLALASWWLTPTAEAQTCNRCFCTLDASCSTCTVGQTITFELECQVETMIEDCPIEEPQQRCCEFIDAFIPGAYYVGQRKDSNGNWFTDANCVGASNPLSYTFVSGDVGEYRRKACMDSSCTKCSPEWTLVTVIDP